MFKHHLDQSQTTYFAHCRWALWAGMRLIWSGIASIIHGIVPSWFDGVAAKTVIDLYHSQLADHPNPHYQQLIQDWQSEPEKKQR
jgi:hypothetical protein